MKWHCLLAAMLRTAGYWMTSVTWSRISGGKVIPRAWAVFRFTTRSQTAAE
jgi:hypothetical protein